MRRLGLDVLDEVEAELAAWTFGEGFHPLEPPLRRALTSRLRPDDTGELVQGHRVEFVLAVGLGERLQGRLVPHVLVLADRLVPPEPQPVQVGVEQRRVVLVVLVEAQHLLQQPDALDRAVVGVGRLRLPRQELGHVVEDGRVGLQVERVLRLAAGLLGGGVEAQGVERHEVEQRGAVLVGDGALFEEDVVLANGRGLSSSSLAERFSNVLSISAKMRGGPRSGCRRRGYASPVRVRCVNRPRFCWK